MKEDEENEIQKMIDKSLVEKMDVLNRNSLGSLLNPICGKWWFMAMVISLITLGFSFVVLYYFVALQTTCTNALVNSITTIIMTCIISTVLLLLACVVCITVIIYPRHNENE